MNIDWQRSRDIIWGMGLETAGRALGWILWLAALWVAVAVIVGSMAMAGWIGDHL